MYTRKVSEFVYTYNVDPQDKTTALNDFEGNYDNILFSTITSYGQRTLFDTLIDNHYMPLDSSSYRTSKINEYKQAHQPTIVKSVFKDFLKR